MRYRLVAKSGGPARCIRALFDAAGHLFMSQLRARPLFQWTEREQELEGGVMVEELLTSEPLLAAGESSRGRPMTTARTTGHADEDEEEEEHEDYEEDEDEDEEGGSELTGHEDTAYEARRRLKRYQVRGRWGGEATGGGRTRALTRRRLYAMQRLRERQRRELLRGAGSRGGQEGASDRRRRLVGAADRASLYQLVPHAAGSCSLCRTPWTGPSARPGPPRTMGRSSPCLPVR